MGTSNFYYKNASKVFAIAMNQEQPVIDDEGNETEETESVSVEEWEYKDILQNIRDNMEGYEYNFRHVEGWNHSAPRSFPSRYIGEWYTSKEYAGVELYLTITAMSNAGYYEGACLDWEFKLELNGSEVDEVEANDLTYYGQVNNGLAKVIAPKANSWIQKTKDRMIEELEQVFAQSCGMTLKPVATFSNGETFYEQVKN